MEERKKKWETAQCWALRDLFPASRVKNRGPHIELSLFTPSLLLGLKVHYLHTGEYSRRNSCKLTASSVPLLILIFLPLLHTTVYILEPSNNCSTLCPSFIAVFSRRHRVELLIQSYLIPELPRYFMVSRSWLRTYFLWVKLKRQWDHGFRLFHYCISKLTHSRLNTNFDDLLNK